MDAALADPRPRRQDHPRAGRAALLDARRAQRLLGGGVGGRGGVGRTSHGHVRLQGDGPRRRARPRARSRPRPSRRSPTSSAARADRPRHRRQARVARDQPRAASSAIKAERPDDHDPPAGDDGHLGHDASCARSTCSRTQTENEKLSRTRSSPSARTSRPACRCRDALERHPKVFNPLFVAMVARRRDRRRARELAACASPTSSRRTTRCAARSSRRWSTRRVVIDLRAASSCSRWSRSSCRCSSASSRSSAASCRRSPSSPSAMSDVVTAYWYVCILGGRSATVVGLPEVEASRQGPRRSGTRFRLRIPFKIGDDRPEGRAGPLVAHAVRARSAAGVPMLAGASRSPARPPATRSSRRRWTTSSSRVKRGGTIAAPLKDSPVFPAMVTHMVGVGEETGALDDHALQDRRLLRGRGRARPSSR